MLPNVTLYMNMSEQIIIGNKEPHHQTDEELESVVLEVSNQPGAIPEHLIVDLSVVGDQAVSKEERTNAMTKKTIDWDKEKKRVELSAERFEILSGSSKLFLYILRQSSSRVKLATVLMAPAASHANCALSEWVRLLIWSFITTTLKRIYPAEITSGMHAIPTRDNFQP
jgi:hypothetical protein